MASKPRHLKTALQLWIIDNRKRLSLEPEDLAELTGVTPATVRGWESRGKPSEDALAILERRFGVAAPREVQAGGGDMAELVAAIRAQTDAITDLAAIIRARDTGLAGLLAELQTYREQTVETQATEIALIEALPQALSSALANALAAMREGDPAPRRRGAAQREAQPV